MAPKLLALIGETGGIAPPRSESARVLGHLPDSLDIGELFAMLAVVGAMYALVIVLLLLLAEPRHRPPRWLREIRGRICGALRLPR